MRCSSPRVPGSTTELAHDDLKRIVVRQCGAHVGAGERVNSRPRLSHVLGRDLRPSCSPRRSRAAHERPRGPLPPQLPCPPSADLEDAAVVRAVVVAEPGDEGGDVGGLKRLPDIGGVCGARRVDPSLRPHLYRALTSTRSAGSTVSVMRDPAMGTATFVSIPFLPPSIASVLARPTSANLNAE